MRRDVVHGPGWIHRKARKSAAPRVSACSACFGSGNIGNDGSLEAVINYLKADHPDAVLDVMCHRAGS